LIAIERALIATHICKGINKNLFLSVLFGFDSFSIPQTKNKIKNKKSSIRMCPFATTITGSVYTYESTYKYVMSVELININGRKRDTAHKK
jgi:hypothetical protein